MRIALGRWCYCTLRSLVWLWRRGDYANKQPVLPREQLVIVARHSSPLYRDFGARADTLQQHKAHNLALALQHLDGICLEPGKTLSFWRLVGKPCARKGYKTGMVLYNGRPEAQVGGGLCQLTNLLYWMTLHSPLKVVERWRHSYDVFPDQQRSQPFGSGATCVYNYRDLQIRNDTAMPFHLHLCLQDERLAGTWLAPEPVDLRYEVYEASHWISHEAGGAYLRHNTLWRRIFRGDELLADEAVAENHALMMYQPLLGEQDA